jgi:hypothetical protein
VPVGQVDVLVGCPWRAPRRAAVGADGRGPPVPVGRCDVLVGCDQRPPGRGALAASRGRPAMLVERGHRGQSQGEMARGVLID